MPGQHLPIAGIEKRGRPRERLNHRPGRLATTQRGARWPNRRATPERSTIWLASDDRTADAGRCEGIPAKLDMAGGASTLV